MLRSITVENYRGFKRKTTLQLRPLTILLGRNSSGKSSLTRVIPLLQQSIERQTSSPILWSSESVDLGNITDVITHGDSISELRIGLCISAPRLLRTIARYKTSFLNPQDDPSSTLEYVIRLSADGLRTKFIGFEVGYGPQRLSVDWDEYGYITHFCVNGVEYTTPHRMYSVNAKTFIPQISRIAEDKEIARSTRSPIFYDSMKSAIKSILHGKTSADKIDLYTRRFPFTPIDKIRHTLSRFPNSVSNKITDTTCELVSNTSMINDIPIILSILEGLVFDILSESAYIGPLRASGSRFNRIQELAVTRINSTGDNTAMYIYSLSPSELASFNDLMIRACGHIIEVEESGSGHVSLKIGRHGQAHFENIADVGFGFSQLIPVVAQLHAVRERLTDPDSTQGGDVIFAVEQPELHLHPAMQANLADLFVGAVKSKTQKMKNTTILVETHSEMIISQLGVLIAEGEISPEEVAIYFVRKDDSIGESTLSEVSFDGNGIISEWPIGFFSAN